MYYKRNKPTKTTLKIDKSYEGETIEKKVKRILNNEENIKDGAPITYTERKEGVKPEYNIRTDRWEIATEAMDKVTKSKLAKREARNNPKGPDDEKKPTPTGDNPPEGLPTQGTE